MRMRKTTDSQISSRYHLAVNAILRKIRAALEESLFYMGLEDYIASTGNLPVNIDKKEEL